MKKILLGITLIVLPTETYSMDNNNQQNNHPLNAQWFYDEKNPCYRANMLLEDHRYQEAMKLYLELLKNPQLSNYDRDMAALNYASCELAQGNAALQWQSFDNLCGIANENKLKGDLIKQKSGTTFKVKTNQIGIGDIVHFLKAIKGIPEVVEHAKVYLVAKKFLHKMLEGPSKEYNFQLIEEQDANKMEGTEIHLTSLLGYFALKPNELIPEKAIYTADEQAINDVRMLLDPIKDAGKQPCPVFIGEDRMATLIGGRQLPYNNPNDPTTPKKRGRHFDAKAFQKLLKKYPKIVLIDCNPESICIQFTDDNSYRSISPEFEQRIVRIPSEKGIAFSTTIALAQYANNNKDGLIGFGADNGPANVYTRALSADAQDDFSFIIPGEYDVRMEGEGFPYDQVLSYCNVYRCKSPEDQENVIIQAYEDNQ